MNNSKKYILFACLVTLLGACDKKEILTGKREEFLKSFDHKKSINKELANAKVQLVHSSSINSYTDIGGNKQHNAINYKMSSNPKVIWKQSFGSGPINSSPISFGGNIYAVDANGVLFCINQKDGKTIWKKQVAEQPDDAVFSGGITAENGIIYASTNIGTIVAIDSKTQKDIWVRNIKIPLKGSPIFVNGKLIVTTVSNQTFALDSGTGKTLWSKSTNKEQTMMVESGTPAVTDNSVICAYSSGDVMSLNQKTGTDNWSDVLFSSNISESGFVISHIAASPVVYGGFVLVATSESKIVLLDTATGVRVWEQEIGTITTPIIMKGWAFVLASNGELVCLSMEDGTIKWKTDINAISKNKNKNDTVLTGPVMVNGNIAVFDSNGNIMSFDATTGAFRKKINADGATIARTPIIINETMYIITDRAAIYAIK